jgi:molybdate transport system ATP-binding protein
MKHLGIYCDNSVDKQQLVHKILYQNFLVDYINLDSLKGEAISSLVIDHLIEEEFKHDAIVLSSDKNMNLESMSSGQQRMALTKHVFEQNLDFIILDDIQSNIDKASLNELLKILQNRSEDYHYIQIFTRVEDVLPYIDTVITIDAELKINPNSSKTLVKTGTNIIENSPISKIDLSHLFSEIQHFNQLVEMRNVSVGYLNKPVLNNINWTIRSGEFWELRGPIGSGKSTLLSMIIGDNPKAFGQDIYLFGIKKGSGESVWEIKKNIGYFYPKMLQLFQRNYTNEEMILSGFYDSIGLYTTPTDLQKQVANKWLDKLEPTYRKKKFQNLSAGQQRIIMLIRAIIKQPPLLILDEPTVGLDDYNAHLFVSLLNMVASPKKITILFVSHRKEKGLKPDYIYELHHGENGSIGKILG